MFSYSDIVNYHQNYIKISNKFHDFNLFYHLALFNDFFIWYSKNHWFKNQHRPLTLLWDWTKSVHLFSLSIWVFDSIKSVRRTKLHNGATHIVLFEKIILEKFVPVLMLILMLSHKVKHQLIAVCQLFNVDQNSKLKRSLPSVLVQIIINDVHDLGFYSFHILQRFILHSEHFKVIL